MAHHVLDVTPEPGNYTNPRDATMLFISMVDPSVPVDVSRARGAIVSFDGFALNWTISSSSDDG
ncbi:MAG: hypothetical protein ACSLFA_17355 [Mycobacterium sp.]